MSCMQLKKKIIGINKGNFNMAKIEDYQKIIDEKSLGKVGKQDIDLFSAQLVVSTYNKLNDENKERLMSMSPFAAVMLCMRLSK